MRLVSELAGGDESFDGRVVVLIEEIIDLCCRSKMEELPDSGHSMFLEAIDLMDQKDWLFVIKKLGNSFELEAKFGTEIKSAKLAETTGWVSQAGIN